MWGSTQNGAASSSPSTDQPALSGIKKQVSPSKTLCDRLPHSKFFAAFFFLFQLFGVIPLWYKPHPQQGSSRAQVSLSDPTGNKRN